MFSSLMHHVENIGADVLKKITVQTKLRVVLILFSPPRPSHPSFSFLPHIPPSRELHPMNPAEEAL